MLGGLAEVLSIDPELLDDLKTSISEACNNVVLHAYEGAPGPMRIRIVAGAQRLSVAVSDDGVGLPHPPPEPDETTGIGVPIMRALADEVRFGAGPDGGTEVQMDFSCERDGRRLYVVPEAPAPDELTGPLEPEEVLVTLSPVSLLMPVLGRLARTLAATAHFSLDRFSDVYLITDTIAAHAVAAAAGPRIAVRLTAADRRLVLHVGPFVTGSSEPLRALRNAPPAPLARLTDEVSVEPDGVGELVRVVMVDHRR
ncbi:MAG: ATP-binding protein [Solirubrobacterales bacterium]|nr:ATP-binding protein [Solirubrobacterales bacterium]